MDDQEVQEVANEAADLIANKLKHSYIDVDYLSRQIQEAIYDSSNG